MTPSDSSANNFARPANSIRVGTGGDVVAIRRDGTAVTFKNCPSGETLPIRAIRVNVSGTTASDLVGL
ncbi:spike base protein, RCAP_Rcc01079 family [Cupriavidus basilensis]